MNHQNTDQPDRASEGIQIPICRSKNWLEQVAVIQAQITSLVHVLREQGLFDDESMSRWIRMYLANAETVMKTILEGMKLKEQENASKIVVPRPGVPVPIPTQPKKAMKQSPGGIITP